MQKFTASTLFSRYAVYLAVTAVLILTDRPASIVSADEPIAFAALTEANYDDMPIRQPYTARDGAEPSYRLYESSSHFPGNSEFPGKSPVLTAIQFACRPVCWMVRWAKARRRRIVTA